MNALRPALSRLFADCRDDPALRQRFAREPKNVLAEYGMNAPVRIDRLDHLDPLSISQDTWISRMLTCFDNTAE